MNSEVVKVLRSVSDHYELMGDKPRCIAYAKGADSIERLTYRITSGKQAMDVPSIGKSIWETIQEIIDTGTSRRLKK